MKGVRQARARFEALRARAVPAVEAYLNEFLSEVGGANAEMAAYHLATGGKRLRAVIPLAVFDACARDPMAALPLGAAVEMIHNATLVHDDLQDGDEVRRGRPTVWKKYSAAQAINCGDAMFQYAFRLLARLEIEPALLSRVMDGAAAATAAVIDGQAEEFRMKDEQYPSIDRYLGVIRGKTSGLFAFPVTAAIIAMGLDGALSREAGGAAMDLGMVFQIQDDLLDLYGQKGRDRAASDIAEGKISFLVAHAYERAKVQDRVALREILRKPRQATSPEDISQARAIFDRCGARDAALARIREIQRSVEADAELAGHPAIHSLLLGLAELFLEPIHAIF